MIMTSVDQEEEIPTVETRPYCRLPPRSDNIRIAGKLDLNGKAWESHHTRHHDRVGRPPEEAKSSTETGEVRWQRRVEKARGRGSRSGSNGILQLTTVRHHAAAQLERLEALPQPVLPNPL